MDAIAEASGQVAEAVKGNTTVVTDTPNPAAAADKSAADKATAAIEQIINKPAAKPAEAKPGDKAAKPGEKVPAEKAPEKPLAELTEPELEKQLNPGTKQWKVYEALKGKATEKVKGLEKQIQDLQKKVVTPQDDKRVAELEGRLKELQGTIKQSAYERSEDFKTQYLDRYQTSLTDAINDVKRLQVRLPTPEGEEQKTRPATDNDFLRLLKLDPADQDEAAERMFGASGRRVQNHLLELQRIKQEGNRAVEKARAGHEADQKAATERTAAEQKQYEQFHQEAHTAIEEKWPDLFSPNHYKDDAESGALLTSGYEYVDNMLANGAKMTADERAATAAVVRARAAAMPLLKMQLDKAKAESDAKIKGLEEELAKYRKSDPGGLPKVPGEINKDPDDVPDIRGAAQMFKRTA